MAGLGLGIAPAAQAKPFEQYIQATPTVAPLTSATWGVAGVLPRDISNGIESAKGAGVHPDYYYWDGEIIKAVDGKYHMFMSTFSGNQSFNPGWESSDAYHAISQTNVLGPYVRQDYVYTNNGSHKGHNVSAAQLSDGSYVVVVSEIVPFTIYKSSSLDGPWTGCQPTSGIGASNISFVERHDGKFEIVERNGTIAISNTLCGNYVKQTPTCTYTQNNSDAQGNPVVGSIYAKRTSIPGVSNPTFLWQEDPHIWIAEGPTTSSTRAPEIVSDGTSIPPTASPAGRTTGTRGLRGTTRRSSVTREAPPAPPGTRWSDRAWCWRMATRRTSPGPWPMWTRTTRFPPAPITAPRSSSFHSTASRSTQTSARRGTRHRRRQGRCWRLCWHVGGGRQGGQRWRCRDGG